MWLLWLVMRNILEYLNKCKDDKKNFLKEGKICYWFILFKNLFKKSIFLMKTKNPPKHLDFFYSLTWWFDYIILALMDCISTFRWYRRRSVVIYYNYRYLCIVYSRLYLFCQEKCIHYRRALLRLDSGFAGHEYKQPRRIDPGQSREQVSWNCCFPTCLQWSRRKSCSCSS